MSTHLNPNLSLIFRVVLFKFPCLFKTKGKPVGLGCVVVFTFFVFLKPQKKVARLM